MNNTPKFYSVRQAGDILGVTVSQILKLIARGTIDSTMVGNQHIIPSEQIVNYAVNRRSVGRPKKVKEAVEV